MSETTNNSTIISREELLAIYAGKIGEDKTLAILSGTSSIISIISSYFLILIMIRSKAGLSKIRNRLLLGMSIGDILYSLTNANFNYMIPGDLSYMVWNANGNLASCDALGFIAVMGSLTALYYSSSLNLYYLAQVRYEKTESYIRGKIEPALHAMPSFMALFFSIWSLVNENYNAVTGGVCTASPVFNPPHCQGIEDGVIREGFRIPCGRGKHGAILFVGAITIIFSYIIVAVSLFMIYKSVLKREKRILRYGRGSLHLAASNTNDDETDDDRTRDLRRDRKLTSKSFDTIASYVRGTFAVRKARNPSSFRSRAVLEKAKAYSAAFFLTWSWTVIAFIILPISDFNIPTVYRYFWNTFSCLQGFFNFIVFFQPKVVSIKRQDESIAWPHAFVVALSKACGGGGSGHGRVEQTSARRKSTVVSCSVVNSAPNMTECQISFSVDATEENEIEEHIDTA